MPVSKRITSTTTLSLFLLLMTGCATPFVNPPKSPFMSQETAVGAASGAEYGAIAGVGMGTAVLPPTGVGLLVGGGIGSYFNSTHHLLSVLQEDGVYVVQVGDCLKIIIPTDNIFEYDGATIVPQNYFVLNDVVRFLKRYGNVPIKVAVYTDDTRYPKHGVTLSRARAKSIVAYLWYKGINYQMLRPIGKGPEDAVASNGNPIGSYYNRRIELTLPVVPYHWNFR